MSPECEWGVERRDTGMTLVRGVSPTSEKAQDDVVAHLTQYSEADPLRIWIRQGPRFLIRSAVGGVAVTV